jgi:hypothetical protein
MPYILITTKIELSIDQMAAVSWLDDMGHMVYSNTVKANDILYLWTNR